MFFIPVTLTLQFMAKEQSSVKERQRTDLREPRRYKVIIYNDDFTTMEFVVLVLKMVFFKKEEEAQTLMRMEQNRFDMIEAFLSRDT